MYEDAEEDPSQVSVRASWANNTLYHTSDDDGDDDDANQAATGTRMWSDSGSVGEGEGDVGAIEADASKQMQIRKCVQTAAGDRVATWHGGRKESQSALGALLMCSAAVVVIFM